MSIAFFRRPGTERLYSGVTNSTASDFCICCLKAAEAADGLASLSWLYSGKLPISTISSLSVGGARAISALASLRLNDSLRRLPTITATLRVVLMVLLSKGLGRCRALPTQVWDPNYRRAVLDAWSRDSKPGFAVLRARVDN